MKRLLWGGVCLLVVATVTSCTAPREGMAEDADRRISSYKKASLNYLACGVWHVKKLMRSRPGTDPYYAAIAAKTSCSKEWLELYTGIQKAHAPETWSTIMRGYEQSFKELAISTATEG